MAFVGDVYLAIQIHDLLLKNNSGRCNQANILSPQSCTTSDFYTCNRKFCLNIVGIQDVNFLTIIPRAQMGSESIAHEAEGRMGY